MIMSNLVSFVLAASAMCFVAAEENSSPTPLANAHAHNDYQHKRPLLDALDCGFCSIEADIFLVESKLLVGHNKNFLKPERTLQSLYLDPLKERVEKNGGRVYPDGPTVALLIDIKSEPKETYAALRNALANYAEMLTVVENGKLAEKAVTVVISGRVPREQIAADALRYAAIDGDMSDLQSALPADLVPWVSDSWRNHFKWRGQGPMPEEEKAKLLELVRKSHQANRRLRFWGTPDNRATWTELRAAGVDLLNTDDLAGLRRFLIDTPARQDASPIDNSPAK
jgi:hypothetical protein